MSARLLLALIPALLLVGACGRPAPDSGGGLRVVATTGMIADAARAVGGERVQVTGLMGEGVDPHLYKASPGDLRAMSDADLVLYNGLHLEGRMADVLEKLGQRRPVVRVTDSIPAGRLRTAFDGAPAGDAASSGEGQPDPHVWFDVSLWRHVVERIRDALTERDPEGAEHYQANASRLLEELAALDQEVREQLAAIPRERRVLVTAHDAFGYFGQAYDVEVMAIQGVSTDSEASIRDINALVDTLVSRRIPAVFVESSVPRKTIDALVEGCRARGHDLRIGGELYSDALGRAGTPEGGYVGMVRHNVRTIVEALAGQASPDTETAGAPPLSGSET